MAKTLFLRHDIPKIVQLFSKFKLSGTPLTRNFSFRTLMSVIRGQEGFFEQKLSSEYLYFQIIL